MSRKCIRHIPDATHLGYTYCGRFYVKGTLANLGLRLALIDLRTDSIEDAECKACQRSDDRRTREKPAVDGQRVMRGRKWWTYSASADKWYGPFEV